MPTTTTPCVVLIGDLPDQVLQLQDLVQDGEVVRIEDPRQVAASAQGKDIMHRPKEQLLFIVFDDGHPAPKRLSGLGYHVVLVSNKSGLQSDPDGCLWVCPNDVSPSQLGQTIEEAGFGGLLPAGVTAEPAAAPSLAAHDDDDTPTRTVADWLRESGAGDQEQPAAAVVPEEKTAEASPGLSALMDAPLDPTAVQEAPTTPEPAPEPVAPIMHGMPDTVPSPSPNGHDAEPETLSLEALLGGGLGIDAPSAPQPAGSPDGSPINNLLMPPGLDGFDWSALTSADVSAPMSEQQQAAPEPPAAVAPPAPLEPVQAPAPPPPPSPPEAPAWAESTRTLTEPQTQQIPTPEQPAPADEDAFVRELLGGDGGWSTDTTIPAPQQQLQPTDSMRNQQPAMPAQPASPMPATGRGKIIFTLVPKGGTGKTSFTAAAAAFASQVLDPQGKSVALLDGNLQQGNILRLMGLPASSPTLFQIAREPVVDQEVVQRVLLRSQRYPLDLVVPSNLATHRVDEISPELITPQLYRKVAMRLAETHNYVFVDTQVAEPHSEMMRDFILPTADFLMVVLDHDQSATDQTIPLLQLISSPRWRPGGSAIDSTRMGIVLNRFDPTSKLTQADLRAQLASWLWMGTVPFYREWKEAVNDGELWFGDDLVPRLNQILWHVTGDWAFRQEEPASGKKNKSRSGPKTKAHRPTNGDGRKWYSFLVPSKD